MLGELFNADPVFSGAHPSIVLCVNRSLPESPRRAAINRFLRRLTGGRIRLSIPEPDLETFWRLDLHLGTTTRLGSFKQDPGTVRTLVPPDPNGGHFSLPRFHRDHVIDMRSNSLWRVDLAGSHPEQLFPAP